jgi:pantoate--beta-alanine ligase
VEIAVQIVKTVAAMQKICGEIREDVSCLGFVPTMGALHDGHVSLVRRAKQECESVTASIFVNPLQFAPGEDYARYPRMFEEDCAKLEAEGVDVLFAPDAAEMYPPGAVTTVTVIGIADRLDGASRPGHFTGVATVVAKLFHAAMPHRAYFGQKDAAQLAVLQQLVRDLNFDVEIVACPIVRDSDGLALSSRNAYLSETERTQALALPRALQAMERLIAGGQRERAALLVEGTRILQAEPGIRVDYLAVVDADTLLPVASAEPDTLVAGAVHVGSTRLIDNFLAV